ncbi:hypothetical protein D9758_008796 [Tetrapyrgos nigripes]|uniref:Uncharacterized protein n=1 Tax=Tetrapyrgos nigripes TaxID=182062 RepID=A0A8H5D3R0_9AGAR|nr:hypothetical protein D9758_008796 [Tetrapyrgos nigripes]
MSLLLPKKEAKATTTTTSTSTPSAFSEPMTQEPESLDAQQVYEVSVGSHLTGVGDKLAGATKEIKDHRVRRDIEAAANYARSAARHMSDASSTNKGIMKNYHKLLAKYDVSRAKSHLKSTQPQVANLFDSDQLLKEIDDSMKNFVSKRI